MLTNSCSQSTANLGLEGLEVANERLNATRKFFLHNSLNCFDVNPQILPHLPYNVYIKLL